jgi:hypothetical protein
MPSLVAKYQEKVTVTKLKKFYSVMSQAYAQAVNEYGTPDGWGLIGNASSEGAQATTDILANYLKVTKNCGTTDTGCWYKYITLYWSPSLTPLDDIAVQKKWSKMLLADGSAMAFVVTSGDCTNVRGPERLKNNCGLLVMDVNGGKPPNIYGHDAFFFYFTKTGIIPAGTAIETTYPFEADCTPSRTGLGCTAWVIYNENQDYLHCDGLSWDGPVKCD